MTPHGYAMSLENAADMLAEALWDKAPIGPDVAMSEDTRKAIRRTIATLEMILDGDIRPPLEMAAEVEGRVDEN